MSLNDDIWEFGLFKLSDYKPCTALHTAQFYYTDPYMNLAGTVGKPDTWTKQADLLNFLPTKVGSLPDNAVNG